MEGKEDSREKEKDLALSMRTIAVSGNTESFPERCSARMLFKESLLWGMRVK